MITEVIVPVLDQTTTEVRLINWIKNEGDEVTSGEVVCEIETEKATVEIESPKAGILRKILIEADTNIPPLTVVALVSDNDDVLPDIDPYYKVKLDQPKTTDTRPTPASSVQSEENKRNKRDARVISSPRARRLADENNIDIASISGSGPRGRILESDVKQTLENILNKSDPRAAQATANRVSESWTTIPHFYTSITVDMSALISKTEEKGAGYTYTDFIILAIAQSVTSQPTVNGTWENSTATIMGSTHLGLVVQTKIGLVIPTLTNIQNHSIDEIAQNRSELVKQAHDGKLTATAMTPATLTLSNIGPGHIDHFTAIISPPQLAILSAGSIQTKPMVVANEIVIKPTATFVLGADHRAIDGILAAAFLESLKYNLEKEV
jgi:pyruvate dehydrogenase E2 component (dihydrolipoamide acetyltransferase)